MEQGEIHKPTDETRATVKALTAFGVPQMQVGPYIGVNDKTLRKYYRHELDTALVDSNFNVAKCLYQNATTKNNVSAQIFWLKTKAGWKDTSVLEVSEKVTDTEHTDW